MLRSILSLTVSLTLLPVIAHASSCSSKTDSRVQETVQLSEMTQQISTPVPQTPAAAPSSPAAAIGGGVETLSTQEASDNTNETVKMAEASPKMMEKNQTEDPASSSIHAPWTEILQSYVSAPDGAGLTHFDYARLKASAKDKSKLESYIKSLEAVNSGGLSETEALAFWANLYNAVTVQVVAENYPIKSIRKLGSFNSGPWKKDLVTVNGVAMSLDDIEHGTMRKKYPSPYIHYMVNCASVGCPNLLNEAWEADSLMAKRKTAAADYINSPRGAIVNGDSLTVSSIYNWFEEDFGGSKDGVLNHLKQYATGDLAAAISSGAEIKKYDYDWSLND